MKANELRIKNLVNHIRRGVIVVGIMELDFVEGGVLDIEPIPLDGKWLKKFGFKKIPYAQILFPGEIRKLKEKEYWYQIKVISEFTELEIDIHFEHDTTITIIIDDHTKVQYIKFVHQLQNLYFALTGEELTIKE